MPKMTFVKTMKRHVYGGDFYFHVYEDARMLHVIGNGDKESTGKPHHGSELDMIANGLIATLLDRGRCPAGEFPKPY
ncbi:hypothetical protein [Rhizobium sp. P44RR-XXIV]|uniref:hypothetical protein n=1 Tax=Rhizobium sp. P44RR-XXIV TaxID=1921145 RepID=UPI000985B9CF|nr:hypothetical protein [Rhizobium sp. P44RR-XXIV]TIX89285.1 hypothetical protein BSK43_022070 [Rhizobium sp. P44RR-XXIV]